MTTLVFMSILVLESLLVAGCWLLLARTPSGSPRQRQGVYLSGFVLLIALPFLLLLPKPFALSSEILGGGLAPGVQTQSGISLLPFLSALWVAGFAVICLGWLRGVVRLRRIVAKSRDLPEGFAVRCRTHLDGRADGREVRIALCDEGLAPCVAKLFRPVLLLPAEACSWSESKLSAVLHHEWNHLRRRDLVVRLIADLACAMHWFNPFARRLRRRYLEEAEVACDGVALRESGMRRAAYAETLLTLALREDRDAAIALPMASRGSLEKRIRAILHGPESRVKRLWIPATLVAFVLMLVGAVNVVGFTSQPGADALEVEAATRLLADPFPGDAPFPGD